MESLIIGERYQIYKDLTGVYNPKRKNEKRFTNLIGENPFFKEDDGSVCFIDDDDDFELIENKAT